MNGRAHEGIAVSPRRGGSRDPMTCNQSNAVALPGSRIPLENPHIPRIQLFRYRNLRLVQGSAARWSRN